MTRSREWHLVRRPSGWPLDADVALVETDVPDPGPGQLLVRNTVMSLEPSMRGRMSERATYTEPYALGAPMRGPAVGEVIASGDPRVAAGSVVAHDAGWREYALVAAPDVRTVEGGGLPASVHLGALGLTGWTAYVGLLEVGRCTPGQTVLVSAGAGAVGATVGQIAKLVGATVVGSGSSPEKVRFMMDELGFDAAFSYRDGPLRESLPAALEKAGSDGVDLYFDNVGGEQLEAAIRVMRPFGCMVLCGAISVYNASEPVPGPRNLLLMIWRRLRMEGFLVTDHEASRPAFEHDMARWLREGSVRNVETVFGAGAGAGAGAGSGSGSGDAGAGDARAGEVRAGDIRAAGIEAAWPAFLAMLRGGNVGKTIVALDDASAAVTATAGAQRVDAIPHKK